MVRRLFTGKWLAALLALTMVIVAGCQAVGGVDLNRVLKNSLKVTAMEGNQTLEFELLMTDEFKNMMAQDTSAEGKRAAAIMDMVSKVKLTLDSVKVKDGQTASMNGSLALGDLAIGFDVKMARELIVIELDGAKEPIVLELTPEMMNALFPEAAYLAGDMPMFGTADEELQAKLTEMGKGIIEDVGGYVIDNLPNPERLSVTAGMETVGSEQVFLSHIAAEINGQELWKWLSDYLDALIADEDGLAEMMTAVVNRILAEKDVFEALGIPMEEAAAELEKMDEELAEGVKDVIDLLKEAKAGLAAAEQEEPEMIAMIFNEDTYLKTDLYVDSKLDIRKSAFELVVKPAFPELDFDPNEPIDIEIGPNSDAEMRAAMMGPLGGIEGIRIAGTTEQWNVNGTVVPDAPVKPENGLTLDEMAEMEGYEAIRFFEQDSDIYDLIVNKLQLNRQEVTLYTEYSDYPPIVTPEGKSLVPLRALAEELGAKVTYDAATNSVKLVDGATDTTILFKKGSKQVTVNGQAATWSYPATGMQDGTLYVPARELVETLGGILYWDTFFETERILVIERKIA